MVVSAMSKWQARQDAKTALGCILLTGILLALAILGGLTVWIWKQAL